MKSQPTNHKRSQPVRIMHFWGGVPRSPNSKWRQTLRIVEKCSELGWTSQIVLSEQPCSNDLLNPFLDAGAKILLHQRPPSSLNFSAIIKTYQFLRHHPCDLIHCYTRPTVPLIAAMLNQIPVRIWSRLAMSSSYENNSPLVGIHKLQLNLRLSCFFSNKILCIAQPVQNELTSLNPSIQMKTTVVGGAIDLDHYSSGCSTNIRKEFSLSENDLIFISVGHAVPVKGWDILLLAYSKFLKKYPQSKLLLVGSTELEHEKETFQSIMQLLETLSLKENVILTGKRQDIPDILAAADIYIQSSRSEGLCGALIEALAAGLPCIASNVGGTTDAIQNGVNGLLFAREDVNGLSMSMLNLAQDIALRAKLSSNASPSVKHFGLEAIAAMVMDIYNKSLTSKGF